MTPADLAAWVAAQTMLGAIAPHANAAQDAAVRAAGAEPYDREYTRRLSHLLNAERDRLVALVARTAPEPAPVAPPAAQGRQTGPQRVLGRR